jgi:hypothetical protein
MTQKYTMYFINLNRSTDRLKRITDDFSDALPDNFELKRWNATEHSQGWKGCIKSHSSLLKHLVENDKSGLYIVLEDDCRLTIPKNIFKEQFPKYIKYLNDHKGKWDVFICGGIYPIPNKIICRDPFIIECSWITCAQFDIHSDKSANSVIKYGSKNESEYDTGIDNVIARSNRNRIWVPYPMFCDQYNDNTFIGNYDSYLPKIIEQFKKSFTVFDEFVSKHTV